MSDSADLRISRERPMDCISGLLNLWNRCFEPDFPLDEKLLAQQLGMERAESRLYLVRDGGADPVAALLAKRMYRPAENGAVPPGANISFVMVDPRYRRRGLATRLWQEAAAWLRACGASYVNFGRDTCHFFPGLPLTGALDYRPAGAWCAALGFEPGALEHDVIADISPGGWPYQVPAEPRFKRWTFEPYRSGLHGSMCDFFAANFPGRWYADTLDALAAGMRGGDLLLALDPDGTVRGFSRIYDEHSPVLGPGVYWRKAMGRQPGGLGPIGIDRAIRGEGLGLALLGHSLAVLQRRGVANVMIDWTDLTAFYAKLGFAVWKSYQLLTRKLEQP